MIRRAFLTSAFLTAASLSASAQFGLEWAEFVADPSRVDIDEPISGDELEVAFAWADLDQDGWMDLVVVRKEPFTNPGKRTNLLLMNEQGVLTDRTNQYASASDVNGDAGFRTPTNDRDVAIADIDMDGWLDVITATTISIGDAKWLGHPRVYRNLGEDQGAWQGLRYEESRVPQLLVHGSGLATNPNFCGIAAGDLTGDGAAEVYFADYDTGAVGFIEDPAFDLDDRLLINDGAGFFVDESTLRMSSAMLESNFGTKAEIVDINGDGWNDVMKSTALGPYHVSVSYNEPSSPGSFLIFDPFHQSFQPYDFDIGDLNQDGRLDIAVSQDFEDRYRLNMGNDVLGRVIWGPAQTFSFLADQDDGFAGDLRIADLDMDGWNDVVITDVDADVPGVGRRIHIYHNRGGVVGGEILIGEERQNGQVGQPGWIGAVGFQDADLRGGHDAAIFDIDRDGDNDMILGRAEGTYVWMSQVDPDICQTDLGFGGPGSLELSVCGPALLDGETATLAVQGGLPFAAAFLGFGFEANPVPALGGTLVPNPLANAVPLALDGAGELSVPITGTGLGLEVVVQAIAIDLGQTEGVAWSNAVGVFFLP